MQRRRRLWRWLGLASGALVLLVGLTVAGAMVGLQGERLGGLINRFLPEMRGQIRVKAVWWRPRALVDLATDRPTPVVVEGLRITDPEGTIVLEVPRLSVKVPPLSAIRGDVFLHELEVGQGSLWRFAKMKGEDAIGFTTALEARKGAGPPPPPPVRPPPGAPPPKDSVFEIVDANLDGLTAIFDFPGAWGLELRDIKAPAWLQIQGKFVGFDIKNLDARGGGHLKIIDDVLPFDRVLVRRVATTREWPDDIFLDVEAAKTRQSTLVGKGFFTGIYGYHGDDRPAGIDMTAEISDAADALAAVASGRAIPGLKLGGRGARVTASLKDAFERLKVQAALSGLDVSFGDHAARGLKATASVDLADPMTIAVSELGFSSPGGGKFALQATLKGDTLKSRMRFDRFATDSYLPADLRRLGAGRLDGRLAVDATLGARAGVRLGAVDLTLARSQAAGLPRKVRLHGQAAASSTRVSTSGLRLEVPGASAELRGEVELARRLVHLALRATTSDLPGLLASMDLPPLARGAALSVEVGGTLDAPEARGEAVVHGVGTGGPVILPEAKASFRLAGGTFYLDSLAGPAFGGTVAARGQVQLARKSLSRMLRTPLVRFRLDGNDLELASLLAYAGAHGAAHGRVSLTATADGPLDRIRARVQVPRGAEIAVLGERWTLGAIDVEADARGLVVRTARLSRHAGGTVQVEGRLEFKGPLAWTLDVRDLALDGLSSMAGFPVSGRVSARLEAGGTLAHPTLAGTIRLAAINVRGVALGDGELVLAAGGPDELSVRGALFQRLELEGVAALGAGGPRANATVRFRQLVLEELVPELASFGDARALATGVVRIEVAADRPPQVELTLSDLQASAARDVVDAAGRPALARVWLRNAGDLRVTAAGDQITLDKARLVTDGGQFEVQGQLLGDKLRAALSGHLDLELLQPLLRGQIERVTGDVAVELAVTGTTARPVVEGSLAIANPIRVQPARVDVPVEIPSGLIRLRQDGAEVKNLALRIDGATLILDGSATLATTGETLAVTGADLRAAGEISARLLETLAPDAVGEASGRAKLRARVRGALAAPEVEARVDLGQIELQLRGVGRRVAIESGVIEATTREIVLRDVRTRIDDVGLLLIGSGGVRPGRVQIRKLTPELEIGSVDLPLRGERIAYRQGNAMEIDDLSFALGLTGSPDRGLRLGGDVRIVSGRYLQDFQIRDLVISPRINEAGGGRPLDETMPLLAEMGLDLRVRTVGDSFVVRNNLAPEIHVIVDLHVGGTLADPRIAGDIRPTDGRFHIIGLRGDFELVPNVNHVTFVPTKSVSDGDTPELNLEAENLINDALGNERRVRMRIHGPLNQAAIDLWTDDGLDRNQTLLLLVSGRTAEDATRFGGTRNPTLGGNVRTGADVAGQITRDTVANLVEPYIGDTLEMITGRTLHLRPTVGADGFELKVGMRTSRKVNLELSLLRGFQNQRRYRGEASFWLVDYLTLRGFGEQLNLTPQQGLTEEVSSLNLELTLDFPIRLRRPH